jgi:hypothetical protein
VKGSHGLYLSVVLMRQVQRDFGSLLHYECPHLPWLLYKKIVKRQDGIR